MHNSFQTTGDMFFRTNRQNRSSKPHCRKRRANSDSELTFMDTSYNHHFLAMHSDDIDIDIMSDTHSDNTVLSGNSAMDPSQMFIMLTDQQHTFPYSPPQSSMNDSNLDVNTDVNADHELGTSSVMDETSSDNALFQTQLYLVDAGIPGTSACITTPQTDASQLNQEQVTGIYAIHTDENGCLIDSSEPPLNVGHIPAKFLKRNLPSQMTPKPVASQVNTENGKDVVNQKWITHGFDKTFLKEKGCIWKNGLWSNDEEELLRNNIDEYCKLNDIIDPTVMIFSTPKEDRKPFYRCISVGLNRPLFAVYRKVLRMYDRKNYIGRYSTEEIERLKTLCDQYKNDWSAIGDILGRSAASVKDRVRLLKCTRKKGKWDKDEVKILSKTIHEFTNTKEGESVTSGINWTDVADKISTRSEKQCRAKWLHYLNWKEAGGKAWLKTDEIELINRIIKSEVTEESHINWDNISNGWASVRSPQWLRNKWWNVKKNAPDYQICSFAELMTYLQATYAEEILQKLKKPNDDDYDGDNDDGHSPSEQFPRPPSTNITNDVTHTHTVTAGNELTPLSVTLSESLLTQHLSGSIDGHYEIPALTFHIQLPGDHHIFSTDVQTTPFTNTSNEIIVDGLNRHNEIIGELESVTNTDNGKQ